MGSGCGWIRFKVRLKDRFKDRLRQGRFFSYCHLVSLGV